MCCLLGGGFFVTSGCMLVGCEFMFDTHVVCVGACLSGRLFRFVWLLVGCGVVVGGCGVVGVVSVCCWLAVLLLVGWLLGGCWWGVWCVMCVCIAVTCEYAVLVGGT